MHHQSSRLSFVLAGAADESSNNSCAQQQHWKVRGTSTLYVTDTAPPLPTTTQLAFHLRGNCQVTSVQVETMGVAPSDVLTPAVKQEEGVLQSTITKNAVHNNKPALEPWKTTFDHMDPLEHVLIKPAGSYTEADFLEPPPPPAAAAAAASTDINNNNSSTTKGYDADTQCSRGAAGMTTGLRAASIASNMGELRLSIERPSTAAGRPPFKPPPEVPKDGKPKIDEAELRYMAWLKEQWEHDLQGNVGADDGSTTATTGSNSNTALGGSIIAHDLHERLHSRTEQRRAARIDLVATRLAEASLTEHGRRAFKITVRYDIPTSSSMPQPLHAGGLHMLPATPHLPPHIYTTAGVFGDHEGTRSWLPCLDSASYKHRASHEWTISVTAPMREGLRVVGAGEDFGVSDTRLHYKQQPANKAKEANELLGADHVKWVEAIFAPSVTDKHHAVAAATEPHVIPPDTDVTMSEADGEFAAIKDSTTVASMDDILATQIWASTSWMPVPARSLGFAIGPFQVVEDPEYFGLPDIELEEEEGGDSLGGAGAGTLHHRRQLQLEREKDRIEDARVRGEGIRQVYFAPFYERKYLHATANTLLLEESFEDSDDDSSSNNNNNNDQKKEANAGNGAEEKARSSVVEIHLPPRTSRQHRLSLGLEETVLFATAGVAHRALSLMRDILALPAYRTSAYTQIWIPHAVNGGYSCGALHSCPEVLGANAFLGGAIIDAGLLPPIGKRITFFQGGGRVLQMIQARCAVRGWVTACLPLGGQDDVGGGYIHSLIESFMMSFYERGHGAFGEGKTVLSE